MADVSSVLPIVVVGGLAMLLYESLISPNQPEGGYSSSAYFDRYMSWGGPGFNSSALVKQTRVLGGEQPNWIRATVPQAAVNDPAEAERMGAAVRNFLIYSQNWEAERFRKNGYRVIVPNNRKINFVKSS